MAAFWGSMSALETLQRLQSQAPGTRIAPSGPDGVVVMKIGELARAAQTAVDTIRHYEREGLLPQPPRSEGNYRIYGPEHVERLGFVRHCRSLDMTLDEIRVLLRFKDEPQAGCYEVNALLDEHIGHVAARIQELGQLERQLRALREQCRSDLPAARCGILDGLAQAAKRAVPGISHVDSTHGRPDGRRQPQRRRGTAC
jgi:Cd(II)/Pb(II)-responsive transcriptional regulator